MIDVTGSENFVVFAVRVLPRAAQNEIVGELDGALKVKIKSPPIDGAANAELVKTLAKFLNVPKSAVEILKGQTSKNKLVKIRGISQLNLPDLKTA